MEINPLGPIAALAAFFSIWFGHVTVRKIEFTSPTIWLPAIIFTALGLITEYCSLLTVHRPLSTVFGILGITFLFDALEFTRQQNRIKKGHAPANASNPRHARILANENFHATTLDLLKREPTGETINVEQVAKLITEH